MDLALRASSVGYAYTAFFLILFFLTGCNRQTEVLLPGNMKDFTVTIENISTKTTLQTGALPDRTAPLGNGVWAILVSGDLFDEVRRADEGTIRLAEDCFTASKIDWLGEADFVKSYGEFFANGGPDAGPSIFTGEKSTFVVRAEPGDKLQIQMMFVQSNDWFYSFRQNGLPLFNGSEPIRGDVTGYLELYDAGSEADEIPGIGYFQKLDQGPGESNIGPDDPDDLIRPAISKHPTLVIPPVESVVRIIIEPR